MAKTTNSEKTSNLGTNYGGGYGKVHIVHDIPLLVDSMPTTSKIQPPPKTKK